MRRPTALAVLTIAILAAPSLAAAASVTGTEQVRYVTRTLASPFPFAKVAFFSDQAAWRVDVDAGAVVVVDASSNDTAPFHLRFHRWDEPAPSSLVPSSRQAPSLAGPGAWRVEVDPAAGARVHIQVRFHGHIGDAEGRAWPFTLTDVARDPGCGLGACLP